MRCLLQPKKTKVRLYYPFNSSKICFSHPSLLTRQSVLVKTERISFESGCVILVAKHLGS